MIPKILASSEVLREWVLAFGILAMTWILVGFSRTILKRLHRLENAKALRELAPAIPNLFYIVGLKVATDVAPLPGKFEKWISSGIYVIAVIILIRFIQKAALIGLEWSSLKANHSEILHQGFIPLLKNVITLFIVLSGGIMILKYFNYDVLSLVTALGVSSLAVGLAAKDTLSNMISGFILIVDRNLRPGDRVQLTGSTGDVLEIGLRSTRIRIGDGNTLIVPNSELITTKILNLSMPSREISCTTSIRVPYAISFDRVKEGCLFIMNGLPQLSPDRGTWVHLTHLLDGYQQIQIGFWVKDLNDSGAAISQFHEKLLAWSRENQVLLVGSSPAA